MEKTTFIQAISDALAEEMEADERVFMIGQDIGLYGGVFKATKGFLDRFGPDRVIDAPISEVYIAGGSVGAAMVGLRPVAEIQFADFITPSMDQIIQQMAKMRYRTGGQWTCPMTIRVACGGDIIIYRHIVLGFNFDITIGCGYCTIDIHIAIRIALTGEDL